MKNIRVFLSGNVWFLEVKFSMYFNRHVLVMIFLLLINQLSHYPINHLSPIDDSDEMLSYFLSQINEKILWNVIC